MKRKQGISLIVLIITIVVIIILAAAIILNLSNTNLIENANEAVVKQDVKSFQDELTLYIADQYADTLGKFKTEDLDGKPITEIIPSIRGTKYEDYLVIEDGKLTVLDTTPEPTKTWAMEALGLVETSNKVPTEPETPVDPDVPTVDTTAPTEPTNLELTVTGNVITAVASGSTDENDFVYEYSIDNTNWQENGEIKNLEKETEYTVYARAKDESGNVSNVINKSIKTKYYTTSVNEIVEDANATIYGELPAYDNPIIPVGFKALETTDATWNDTNGDKLPDGWNNGLVIQDKDLNEFVWVPCSLDGANGSIKYTKNFTYPSYYSATSKNTSDDIEALPMIDETTRVDETEQITKFGGFYIGRYEAGVPANQTAINGTRASTSDVEGIPVVKKGATVWTYISYNKAMPNAKKLYENSTSVRSGLLTGTAWDTVCAWIHSETDSNGNVIHDVTDSRSWGNHSNTTGNAKYDTDGTTKISGKKQTAGYSEYWKAKNIYDLAGNTYEWTGERYSTNRIYRGGLYCDSGSTTPASYRFYSNPSNTDDFFSFRVALYIM